MGTKRITTTVLRNLALFAALAGISAPGIAQVVSGAGGRAEMPRVNIFGVGLFGGPTSGVGLSFRHHLPNPLSYQITGGIIKQNEVDYAIGGELQFDIGRSPWNRIYTAVGIGYYYSGTSERNELSAPFRCGVGLGGEVLLGPGIHLSVELLFTFFSDNTVMPLPQAGVFYYFY
jgi:hypothetical protein